MFIFVMEKAYRNKPLCVVDNVLARFHFPFPRKAALGEGDYQKLRCF